jgi:hypothetical protein
MSTSLALAKFEMKSSRGLSAHPPTHRIVTQRVGESDGNCAQIRWDMNVRGQPISMVRHIGLSSRIHRNGTTYMKGINAVLLPSRCQRRTFIAPIRAEVHVVLHEALGHSCLLRPSPLRRNTYPHPSCRRLFLLSDLQLPLT